jgi:N-acetylmuramoyl-L-alanine amidase
MKVGIRTALLARMGATGFGTRGWSAALCVVFCALSVVLAQAVATKPLEVGGVKLTASVYNGAAFAPAFDFAGALGVDVLTSDDAVTITQGGRILRLDLADDANAAATRFTRGLQVNGIRQAGLAAGRGGGRLLLPVRTVAEAVGASFSDAGGRIVVEPAQAKLEAVKSDKTTRSERLVLELNRDTGYSSRIERDTLVVFLRYTTGETTDYQVSGQFIKTASVRPSGNKLEIRVPIASSSGYNMYALPAQPGAAGREAVPARVVVDIGPRFDRQPVALQSRAITVVLDAGHGGSDTGVAAGTVTEKDLTLRMARLVGATLQQRVKVVYTRNGDANPSLEDRLESSLQADAFISFHASKLAGSSAKGVQIYYRSPDAPTVGIYKDGRALLEKASASDKSILERFIASTVASQAMADAVSARVLALSDTESQVLEHAHAIILTRAPKAAIQVDLGWLSSDEDVTRLSDAASLRRLAQAIADGVYEYLKPQIQGANR